jgi:hypothetical protein
MKALPIGISTLATIIDADMVYVDKTGIIGPLVTKPGRYFLARPRRFGKSLLVDTFRELFRGNERLFRGLTIHDTWDWSRKYPVIKIDFASGVLTTRKELDRRLIHLLKENARNLQLDIDWDTDLPGKLENLITEAAAKFGLPVVVLVDEYDKPLLDNIEEPAKAAEMRDGLKNFYSILKRMDEYLHFIFLTGVSKFSKVNIFSGLNNLQDITLDKEYGTLCGYTQSDLETYFILHLEGVDREELRLWYNGYGFLGEPVYNPFDILLFIQKGKLYRNYWFETGTPSFLVRLMQQKRYFLPDLDCFESGEELLSSFEIETLEPVTLLFQSGYLTIKRHDYYMGRQVYTLGFPNLEVKTAFADFLAGSYTGLSQEKLGYEKQTWQALREGDLHALEITLRRLFAAIPWRNFTKNDLAENEGFYASVLYAYFSAVTGEIIPEDITNHGQADMTVLIENYIYVLEIKVCAGGSEASAGADTNSALEQILARNYAEKYIGRPGKRVFEVGMVFSRAERNLADFAWRERA